MPKKNTEPSYVTKMCSMFLRVEGLCHSDGKHHVICVSSKHKAGCVSIKHKIVISLTAYASAVTVDNDCIHCLWKKKTKNHIKSLKMLYKQTKICPNKTRKKCISFSLGAGVSDKR